METTIASDAGNGATSARGTWISTPPWRIGAVIMKITSRVKATSTRLMRLMSAVSGIDRSSYNPP